MDHLGTNAAYADLQKRAGRKIALAVLIVFLSFGVLLGSPSLGETGRLIGAGSALLFLGAAIPWFWGLADYAASKGYSRVFAVAGLLNVIGLIVLAVLPSKVETAFAPPADANSNYPRPAMAAASGASANKVRLGQWACVLFLLGVLCLAGGNQIGFMLFQAGVPRGTALMLVDVLRLIGVPAFLFAHGFYGRSKGYSFAATLWGLLPCIGLVVLLLLPDRSRTTAASTRPSKPTESSGSGQGYANYKRPY